MPELIHEMLVMQFFAIANDKLVNQMSHACLIQVLFTAGTETGKSMSVIVTVDKLLALHLIFLSTAAFAARNVFSTPKYLSLPIDQ